ncbi:MAG: TonB-dependent receptor [Chlorobiaceae bacterium]|nr:TonB-dependent receptor [Chlorobiaceae bacterium]
MPEVVVSAKSDKSLKPVVSTRLKTSDTAALLSDEPGVSLQTGGGVSSLPVVNGLGDDRLMVCVDCMEITSACANHMNPPLSYLPPSNVGSISVNAGVTPVSMGGDNIGGTIVVESVAPVFASNGKKVVQNGSISSYYRSNNHARGVSVTSSVANNNLSFGVTASHDRASDYFDGHGNRVTSTYYESNNLGLTLAAKTDSGVITVKAGHQSIPDQGFVNQWMDMIDNDASFINAGYKASYDWGKLDASAYWQNTWHKMDSGREKLEFPLKMPHMPMETRGINIGYSIKPEFRISSNSLLRIGNEYHRFTLDDLWPPVAGSMTMSPNSFLNIYNGERDRFVLFAEWESRPNDQLTTIVGVRNEQVRMDTGDVHGYKDSNGMSPMVTNYKRDSDAFNLLDRRRTDSNWDISAMAKLEPSKTASYELGYARKTRSPNLYERYAWSTMWMCSGMLGWFGDGNGYLGNPDLKPEVAHTISISADFHDSDKRDYEVKVAPFYTYVNDYIGVEYFGASTSGTRNILRFVNQDAALYGINISGKTSLWKSGGFGSGKIGGTIGYVHGKNLDTGNSLYHQMPLNLRMTIEQQISGWTNVVEVQVVDKKSNIEPLRLEPKTSGYALVNLRTAYQYKNLKLDLGVMNLFDKFYYLPLGGVNYDQSLEASGKPLYFDALAGQGRSFMIGMTQSF